MSIVKVRFFLSLLQARRCFKQFPVVIDALELDTVIENL